MGASTWFPKLTWLKSLPMFSKGRVAPYLLSAVIWKTVNLWHPYVSFGENHERMNVISSVFKSAIRKSWCKVDEDGSGERVAFYACLAVILHQLAMKVNCFQGLTVRPLISAARSMGLEQLGLPVYSAKTESCGSKSQNQGSAEPEFKPRSFQLWHTSAEDCPARASRLSLTQILINMQI